MERAPKRRRRNSSSEAAALHDENEKHERRLVLDYYRKYWRHFTKPNLTDCRYQGTGWRRGGASTCAGRVCCPTGTEAEGKCRRTRAECDISGVHPSQRAVRARTLTRFEVDAIRRGVLTQGDVVARTWTLKQIVEFEAGTAAAKGVRDESNARKHAAAEHRAHVDAATARRAVRSLDRDSVEMRTRQHKVRAERRLDPDARVAKHLRRRLSR